MKPRRSQKIRWSPKLAYAIGLIATDGNLSNDRRHINLTSKDLQLLKTFKRCLGLKNKIGLKRSGFSNKKYFWVQFGDVILYRWLLKIGLTPAKSRGIKKLSIPNRYFFDFLRGVFDGDGSCCGFWDKRWKNSFMFYIYLYSGSFQFLKWLRNVLQRSINIYGAFSRERNVWRLKYAKNESRLLFSKMYHQNRLPCLKRKYIKLKSLLSIT